MNVLTSYTVFVGSVNGTDVVTELSSLATGPSGPNGFVAAQPVDMLTSGTPLQPMAAPGAVVAFPDGSTVIADALGNFDASQAPWTIANQAAIAAGSQVEVFVDATSVASGAAPIDTFVNVDEPAGSLTPASGARITLAASPPPAPAPVLAKLQIVPASEGMYDKEQRTFHAIGFDKNGKKVALGKQQVGWTVANCRGAAAAGKLQATKEASNTIYRAPATGNAGACADILTASYSNATAGAALTATAKAYYAAHETAVLYTGTVRAIRSRRRSSTSSVPRKRRPRAACLPSPTRTVPSPARYRPVVRRRSSSQTASRSRKASRISGTT
jgi:hypothetical protein